MNGYLKLPDGSISQGDFLEVPAEAEFCPYDAGTLPPWVLDYRESQSSEEPDWDGFRSWRYSLHSYLSLMDSYAGRMQALENSLGLRDYDAARVVWNGLVEIGAIAPELRSQLATAAVQFNLPSPLLEALSN
jgi:hypothetical protein